MQDFLLFKSFITPSLLIIIYYVGAVLIPLASWIVAKWIQKNYFTKVSENIATKITTKQRFYLITAFIFCFLCMEVFWRIMFEFLIAYFDMHDALMQLSSVN